VLLTGKLSGIRTAFEPGDKMLKVQNRYSPYSQPSGGRGKFRRPQFTTSSTFGQQQQPQDFTNRARGAHEGRAAFVRLSDIGGENVQSGLPVCLPLQIPLIQQV